MTGKARTANVSFNERIKNINPMTVAAVAAGVVGLAVLIYSIITNNYDTIGIVHGLIGLSAIALVLISTSRRPISKLISTARRVAAGDLTARVDLGGRRDLKELADAFNAMAETVQQRTEDLQHKVDEVTVLYEVSRALSSTLDLEGLLESTLDAAMQSFGVDSGYLVLRDPDTEELRLRASRGVAENAPDARAVRASMSEWVVGQGRPLIFNPSGNSTDTMRVDPITGALAAVCVPLFSGEKVIGAIAVGSRDPETRFGPDHVRMLSTIANHLSVAIGNTELFESLQEAYLATVRSLAAAVDAKEPHMRGHSERVAVFARLTGEKMGLPHEQRTALEMAAYLHDIGKIGISGAILRKDGPLAPDESAMMRHHPLIGANILRPVAFPWPIAPVVRHHHEHYDGSGYPAGLRGDEIPILARVLGVTDAYEAMIADRPYRAGFSQESAIEELKRCSGTQFDPKVVEALLEVLHDADLAESSPRFDGGEADIDEARAVCVAVIEGMFDGYRRLCGSRLARDLDSEMAKWLRENEPCFVLQSGRVGVDWAHLQTDDEIGTMRAVVEQLGEMMSGVTGRNLVDYFYREAVDGLSDRLRYSAESLRLYSSI